MTTPTDPSNAKAPSPGEVAEVLRDALFALRHARTAMLASIPSERLDWVRRDIERCGEAMKEIGVLLAHLPPEPPLTPEQEERARVWIGRALDRLDG